MKCPYCEKEIQGSPCPQCESMNPEGAKYCMECGFSLDLEVEADIKDTDDIDLDNRVLCPDGTCTGILINGRCSECGKVFKDEKEIKEE